LDVDHLNIVIFSIIIFTFHASDLTSMSLILQNLKQISTDSFLSEKFLQTSDFAIYSVLNSLSALYEQYSGSMVMEGEALDELVLVFNADAQGDLLRRIGTARRTLSFLRSHIRAKRDILSVLTTKDIPLVTKDTKVYLRDVLDKYNRMEESLLLTKDTLNNLHATYLARISIEVAEASNKVNEIMKNFWSSGYHIHSFRSCSWNLGNECESAR